MTDKNHASPSPSRRLSGLPGYGKGRVPAAQPLRHRLGSNEGDEPPGPAVVAAARAALEAGNRYPDLRGETLVAALAQRYGLRFEQVAVAAGSVVLLDQLIRAYCDPGDEIVTPWRSYEAYPIVAGSVGARLVEVPLDADHAIDPSAVLAAIGPRCRVVLLCSPNNPTGTALPADAIDRLVDAIPGDLLVILDEAYGEYAGTDAAPEVSARRAQRGNVAVLRTFSKAWGLAGLRVGYCLADPAVIDAAQAVAPPFPLTAPTLAAATAALGETGVLTERVARNAVERERMSAGLAAAGLPVTPSAANFIWLPVGAAAEALTAHFRDAGIAVRCFAGEGVRITTGAPADTDAVLAAGRAWAGHS